MAGNEDRFEDKLFNDAMLRDVKNLVLVSGRWLWRVHVINRLLPRLRGLNVRGVYTEDIFEGKRRTGYRVFTLDGRSRILAHEKFSSPVNADSRYRIDASCIEEFINPEIGRALDSADCLLLGQIGKIELGSANFRRLFLRALEADLKVITTLPNYRPRFLDEIRRRPDLSLVEITKENEDFWPDAILKGFLCAAGSPAGTCFGGMEK